jgi:hypothetical protein
MSVTARLTCAAAALFALNGPARAVDKFDNLLRNLPAAVNSVVIADVGLLYGSPLGTREKWAATSALGFPAGIQQVALAAKLDFDTLHVIGHEYGVAYLKVRLTMEDLAAREQGAVDTIGGLPAVLSPRNAYFIDFRPWTVGYMAPANRQDASQWVRFARDNPRPVLSPFLSQSMANTDRNTQFVMAFDLADCVNSQICRTRLAQMKSVAEKKPDVEALAQLIASVQGLRLEVKVANDIQGELRVEFEQEVGPFAAVALPLFQEVLARRGAALDEVANWTASANGKAVVFRGKLSEKAFRRVAAILQPPNPNVGTGEDSAALVAELRLRASQHYMRMVTNYLDDLKRPTSQARRSYENYALWYETFAQKIGQLPPYNVDEELPKYGYGVSERLQAIAASLRGEIVDVNNLEKKISYGVSLGTAPGWGWWPQPFVFINTNQAQIRAQQQEAIDKGESTRQEIWKTIEAKTTDIRSRMGQKFQTAF